MPKLVLTYFDFDGSRGEVARLAMYIAGIEFEDRRIARNDWSALRDSMPYQALPVLEVDGQVIAHSNTINIGNTFALEGEAKKKAREALAAGPITRFLQQLESRLKAGGGEWFAERRLTVADLKCFLWVRWLKSGALDHIPADIVDRHAPLLAKHLERVKNYPKIAAYYAARGK